MEELKFQEFLHLFHKELMKKAHNMALKIQNSKEGSGLALLVDAAVSSAIMEVAKSMGDALKEIKGKK